MGEIVAGSRVMVRLEAEAEDHEWPEGCASFGDVFGDADAAEPDEGFEAGTVIRLDEDGETPIALVVWDGLADCAEDVDGDGMPSVWAWRVPLFALMPHGSCRSRFERLVDPVRQIATAIGTPANVDPLADLPAEAVGEIERLRAHNARMVDALVKMAHECKRRALLMPECNDRTTLLEADDEFRRLAAGEVDDG